MKARAIKLWDFLDDIDTASDAFKPSDSESCRAYFKYVEKKSLERYEVFTLQGSDLFTKEGEQVTHTGSGFMKTEAVKLWDLLNAIDLASAMFKPANQEGFQDYFNYVDKMCRERFEIFISDGYDLFTKEGKRLFVSRGVEKT